MSRDGYMPDGTSHEDWELHNQPEEEEEMKDTSETIQLALMEAGYKLVRAEDIGSALGPRAALMFDLEKDDVKRRFLINVREIKHPESS